MRIAIEAQRIFRKEKHGMDYVVLEIIRELQKIDFNNEYYIIVSPGDDICLYETHNFHIVIVNGNIYPIWEQIALPWTIKKINPDILHCTSNTAPILCNTPLILTLHDIIFLENRYGKNKSLYQTLGWHYRKFIVPRILKKCKKIITVSDYECRHISKTLKIDKKKLCYVYNGYSPHFHMNNNESDKNDSYILFFGNTDPKKNTANVLIAYNEYLKRSKNRLRLMIVDLKESIINQYLEDLNIEEIKNMIYCPGYISNNKLPEIYNNAFAFVYTSLRESFGIPILESMACGTPVITSKISAMPEIAGREGILINPYNPSEVADSIIKLEENKEFYNSQVEYGLNRVKDFSWNNAAKNILNIYNTLLS